MAGNRKTAAGAGHSVRPKATHRKQRSTEKARTRLEPVQDRSRKLNEAILSTAATLLETVNIDDLSHSDIAEIAGMSKAAVYYHYPTVAAIQLALGRKYDTEVSEYMVERRPGWPCSNWQEFVKAGVWVARDWFNAHRPACETLLGPLLARENKLAGFEYNTKIGATLLEGLRQRFVMPEHADLEEIASYNGEIIDLFWSRSYIRQGTIDDHANEEAIRASMGYLKAYIPEVLPKRPPADD